MKTPEISGYRYAGTDCGCVHEYVLPAVSRNLNDQAIKEKRVFDLGCGNGSVAAWLATQGYSVVGVDPSETGIAVAKRSFPSLNLNVGSSYDPLHEIYGTFPAVVSLEVIEYVYAPRSFAKCVNQ